MKLQIYVGFIIGILALSGIFLFNDISLVFKVLERVGPLSLFVIIIIHILTIILCGFAWRVLFISSEKRLSILAIWARYLRDSIGNIFGIIPITGEIAAARELTFHGIKPTTSGATLVVDITAELIGQLTTSFVGLIIILKIAPQSEIVYWLLCSFGIATLCIALFFIAQRYGITNFLERLLDRFDIRRNLNATLASVSMHSEIESIYNEKWRLPLSVFFHILSCLSTALETWIALFLLNQAFTFSNSLALQSIVTSGRTLAFFVPWGAGIQEGGYVVVGSLLGIEPYIAIALSLMKRTREIVMGIAGVFVWQVLESHRLWRAQAR